MTMTLATDHRVEYRAFRHMIDRCTKPEHPDYPMYGGRGIAVCDRWLGADGFARFFEDLGAKPARELQLGRVDPNGPYAPENCRWVTARENSQARRDNVLVTIGGVTKAASAWARDAGMRPQLFTNRLARGWDPLVALRAPKKLLRRIAHEQIAERSFHLPEGTPPSGSEAPDDEALSESRPPVGSDGQNVDNALSEPYRTPRRDR